MNDFPKPLRPTDIVRLVGDTISPEITQRGLILAPDAFTLLLSRAIERYPATGEPPPLDPEKLKLDTTVLLTELRQWQGPAGQPITANMIADFFKDFCKRHPDFYPFCVKS
jgi:hypothetical protein